MWREAQTWPYGIDHNGIMGANALGKVMSCALKREVRCHQYLHSRFPFMQEKSRTTLRQQQPYLDFNDSQGKS